MHSNERLTALVETMVAIVWWIKLFLGWTLNLCGGDLPDIKLSVVPIFTKPTDAG